ncbi:pyridoxamine 5'-phosphate oxidase family protein [candidate division KSB1 bacterium]|nr:pyridoxamine 5'-phosphate oxidase family protein [candidate division KSB1 bacterium]
MVSMIETDLIWNQLHQLLMSQRFAVVATYSNGQPYASLVAFVAKDDLAELIFVTRDDTRKYKNLMNEPRAAMMIDNRSNKASDIDSAFAVTACGDADVVDKIQSPEIIDLYVAKHPQLEEFVLSPRAAVIGLKIKTYYFVKQFQNVHEIKLK